MKFLTGVLIITVASAIGLILLHFFGKKPEPAKPADAKPASPPVAKPADAKEAPKPAGPESCLPPSLINSGYSGLGGGSGFARPIRAKLQLSHVLADEFDKLQTDVMAWKPATSMDAVQAVRVRIMKVVHEWESGKWTPPKS